MIERLARYFSDSGTQAAAEGMAAAYRDLNRLLREDRLERLGQYLQSLQGNVLDHNGGIYDKSVSLFQGARTIRGNMGNMIAAYGYNKLFSLWEAKMEQKVKIGRKRDIDMLIELPRGDIYVSITTQPQERKDKVWPAEREDVLRYRNVHGIDRPFEFIALFYEYKKDATVDDNRNAVERKKKLMNGSGVTVACAMLTEDHASILSRIAGNFV